MDHDQLAEAHQRIAEAHAHLAGLLQGRCVQPRFLIPEAAHPSITTQGKIPAAADGRRVAAEWRLSVGETLRGRVIEHFGRRRIRFGEFADFVESFFDLPPCELEPDSRGTPLWRRNLQSAIKARRLSSWGPSGPLLSYGPGHDEWRIIF